jgi:D-amino peptidase
MVRLQLLLILLAGHAWGGSRIFIVTDMEGVGGVNNADEQLLPGQRRYDESRRFLTGELNAAIEGALAAGATEIVVWDGHDGSRSLSIEDVHPRARLIQGKPTPANYYLADRAFDGIFFVGQHAMAGARGGVLAHSQSFSMERITINGRSVGEIGQTAAIAGYFHIPVIMLAGDQAACEELRELQPKAETVAVKRLAGKGSSLSISHAEAKTLIKSAATRAVKRIAEFSPWAVEGPVEMIFRYHPKDKETPPRINVYKGQNVLEAYEAWLGK